MKRISLFIFLVLFSTSFSIQHKQWVAIGDSITYLNDHPEETGNRVTKGYMTRVVEKLPELDFINRGRNGWTSGDIAAKIETLDIPRADIYSVFLGTNDLWRGRTLGTLNDYKSSTGNNTVFGSFRLIINKLRSLNNKAQIILMTPIQRGDFVYINNMANMAYGSYREKESQSLEQFANAILEIGSYEKLVVVDLYHKSGMTVKNMVKFKRLKEPATGKYKDYVYPDFVDVPLNPKTDEYPYPIEAIDMTYDGLHPSDEGNAVIAKMLVEVLKN